MPVCHQMLPFEGTSIVIYIAGKALFATILCLHSAKRVDFADAPAIMSAKEAWMATLRGSLLLRYTGA